MELGFSEDQEALTDAFGAFFAKESPPAVVREAEPLGFSPTVWGRLVAMGATAMGSPEDLGGGGASTLDLALVVELAGRHLAPVPLVEVLAAGRVLARAGAAAWLSRLHDGAVVTVAPRPVAGGVAPLVPAGAVADAVIALDGDRLVLVAGPPPPALADLGTSPLADRPLVDGDVSELAQGEDAVRLFAAALDDLRVLAANALVGVAGAALDIGVDYVKVRHQFGKPIGSFQSIGHRLADDATACRGATLLARKAAWAADEDPSAAHALALMASIYCGQVANRVVADSLHFHGGYGFMLEYDIQLHHRRARTLSVLFGDVRRDHRRLAAELFMDGV